MDQLRLLEIELHKPAVRSDVKKVAELLHAKFIEIGFSGKTHDFESVLSSIVDVPSGFEIWSQNYEFIEYSVGLVQVIYLSANIDVEGGLHRHAKRASMWVYESDRWQMRFHQATPVAPFTLADS